MALPIITNLARNGSTNYYTVSGSNASRGLSQNGVAIYAIDAAGGQNDRFNYQELFTAINNMSGFTVTQVDSTDLSDLNIPSRTITATATASNQTSVFCIRRGTLFHEIPGSTYFNSTENEFIWPLIGAPPLYPSTEGSASNIAEAEAVYDTDFTGNHDIKLGTVYYKMNNDAGFQMFGSQIRPADFGDSTKGANRGETALLGCPFFPGPNQRMTVTDNRLIITANGTDRTDVDFYGTGILDIACIVENRRSGNFFHNGNFNQNSNIRVKTLDDQDISITQSHSFSVNGKDTDLETTNTTRLQRLFSGVEPFTTNPAPSYHYYLDAPGLKSSAGIDFVTGTLNERVGQFEAAFVGAQRFQDSETRNGIVIQGLKSTAHRYWFDQFDGNNVVDILQLDPPVLFTATNTPYNMAEASRNSRRKDTVFLRSIAVDVQDSEGNAKATPSWVVGFQASGTSRTRRSNYFNRVAPNTRTLADGGRWTSRRTDTQALGNAGVVGRGCHYLIDAVWHDTTSTDANYGSSVSDYTRYDDTENATYTLCRGGWHRIERKLPLRSTNWDFNSTGSTGTMRNIRVNDISGISTNQIEMFQAGLGAQAQATPSGSTTMTLNVTGFTAIDGEVMVGATPAVTGVPAGTTITAVTVNSGTQITITLSAATTAAISANTIVTIAHTDYTWNLSNTGVFTYINSNNNKTLTFTGLAALVQAKLELIADRVRVNQDDSDTITTTQDHTISASFEPRTYLSRMTNNFDSEVEYITAGTPGRVTVRRFNFTSPNSGTLTINPDSSNTFLDFGPGITVPSYVTINGSYTDSDGTPSFIDLNLPSGVVVGDLRAAVAYQDTDNNWAIASNPVPTTVGNRTFVRVSGTEGPGASFNADSVWYLAITGDETRDFRATYTGPTSTTVTLTAEPLRPAGTSDSNGTMDLVSMNVSDSDDSESFTIVDTDTTHPATYINNVNRLGLRLNSYDNRGSSANIQLDGLETKLDKQYTNFVARYGSPATQMVQQGGIFLDSDNYRIYVTGTSNAAFLFMSGAVANPASNTVYIQDTDAAVQGFFTTPTYDPALVRVEVNTVATPQHREIVDKIAGSSIGIPQSGPTF